MKKSFLLLYFVLFSTNQMQSQSISNSELFAKIKTISTHIRNNYVFKQEGNKIADYLLAEYKKGSFKHINTSEEFSTYTTKILQEFSNDGHLYVKKNPIIAKQLMENTFEYKRNDKIDSLNKISNYGFKNLEILENNIGYLKLSEINITEESVPILVSAFKFLKNTSSLIIDLRDNGGGGSEVGPVLESVFLEKNTCLLELKERNGTSEIAKTLAWLPTERYEKPVLILINKKTASAAEYFSYSLQMLKRAKIVGEKSAGAANMNSWFPVDNDIFLSVSTASPTIPGTKTSWERIGIKPDYAISSEQALEKAKSILSNNKF